MMGVQVVSHGPIKIVDTGDLENGTMERENVNKALNMHPIGHRWLCGLKDGVTRASSALQDLFVVRNLP